MINAWIAALRIARRDAWRAKGRSFLIVLMIAVPVMLMTTADVLARSSSPSDYERIKREVGGADLTFSLQGSEAINQNPTGQYDYQKGDGDEASTIPATALPTDLATLFPAGSTVIEDQQVNTPFETTAGLSQLYLRGLDVNARAGSGLYKVEQGALPKSPDEVAINDVTAKKANLTVGSTLSLPSADTSLKVVGIVENPRDLSSAMAVTTALPASLNNPDMATYRATLGGPFNWDDVKRLNGYGILVAYPPAVLNPPPASEIAYNEQNFGGALAAYGVVILVGGLAALEICLLAGTAFAVGARRQRRSLALVVASGGTKRQVRNIVLSTGIVLGLLASVVGVLLGIAIAIAFQTRVEEFSGQRFVAITLIPKDLAVIALLGLVTALVSAVLPARAATKMDASAALAGRPDPVRTKGRHRLPIFGAVVFALGIAVLVFAATQRSLVGIMVGAVLAELGVVMLTSTLLGFFGRFGKRLPIAPRMALRDAVRNRPRTTPAVAAIMAGIAGATSISMFVLGYSINDREDYKAQALPGQIIIPAPEVTSGDVQSRYVDQIEQALPIKTLAERNYAIDKSCGQNIYCNTSKSLEIPEGAGVCDENSCVTTNVSTSITIADENTLHTFVKDVPAGLVSAMNSGQVLVTDSQLLKNGQATLATYDYDKSDSLIDQKQLPAQVISIDAKQSMPGAFVSRQTADQLGLSPSSIQYVVTPDGSVSEDQLEATQKLVGDANGKVYVERGYTGGFQIGLLILAIASTVLALLATAIATGLALADGAADQSTLSAVGANPRFRRTMSAFQASVVALLGVGLGLLSGALPGAAFVWFVRYQTLDDGTTIHRSVPWLEVIPWTNIGMLVIVVPIVAAAFAWLFTKSNVAISRRAAV